MVQILPNVCPRWHSMYNLSLTVNISPEKLNEMKENCVIYRPGYPGQSDELQSMLACDIQGIAVNGVK
jgi:hypothetical protein